MDMMEMTGQSKSERELKSMHSVGGSLIAENFSASSSLTARSEERRDDE